MPILYPGYPYKSLSCIVYCFPVSRLSGRAQAQPRGDPADPHREELRAAGHQDRGGRLRHRLLDHQQRRSQVHYSFRSGHFAWIRFQNQDPRIGIQIQGSKFDRSYVTGEGHQEVINSRYLIDYNNRIYGIINHIWIRIRSRKIGD